MSDRERAREIVGNGLHGTTVSHERRLYLQDAIATALAQARAEGQEAMTVAEIERTIANEALRRAAEVAEDYADHYLGGSEGLAAAILDLIKEPGHE